jgi:hypothetical protein
MDTVTISNSAPPPPVACPTNWTCSDIGNPALTGSESLSNGVWSIQGSGYDIWNTGDQFHFDWKSLTGDGALSAHVASQQNTDNWAKSGLMLRASTDPGAAFYAVFVTPANGIVVQYRTSAGASAQQAAGLTGSAPVYLQIGRSGTSFAAYTSSDGVTWSVVSGSTVTIASLTGTLLAGMAVTSHNANVLSTASFDSVTFSTCPAGWSCADIGNPALAGGQSVSNGVWTVQGAGSDIWGTSDQFHYDWQTVTADGAISAHVTSQTNTSSWAKAGVMFRASTNAGAAYYAIFVTPANGISVQYRTASGVSAQHITSVSGTVPAWLKIARSGTAFSAYTSSDGVTWTLVPSSSMTLGNLTGTLLSGLAVTSHNGGALSTATFDTVNFSTCPAGWSCADIGNPTLAGGQSVSNGTWTVQGAGYDIWNTSDQFHYDWRTLAGDGTLSTHVLSQQNTDNWAKAGLMFRASTDPGAAFYDVVVTPANGISVQYRTATGASAQQVTPITGAVPTWLKIARAGTTFSAYTSADGATWTLVPSSSMTLGNLTGTLLSGLAVTSHNGGALSTVAFTVALSACPAGWSCADVGNPALAGNETLSNGTWTVQGAGSDIWNTSDQFHYDWQTLAGDGSVSANVTSQTNTSAWAKAGVMLRASTDPGAAYYAVLVTPAHGIVVQYRTAQGAVTSQIAITGTVPTYLKVSRAGTVYTAYTSTDGTTWTQVPGSAVTLTNLSGTLLAGMAVTSHNGNALSTVTFQAVKVG